MSIQPSTISIGSQLLLGDDDVFDVEWGFESIEGWHSGPGVNVEQVQRTVSHGQFAQAGHRTGRTISLTGWCAADDRLSVVSALNRLAAVLGDGGFDTFTFTDSDFGSLHTEVQLLGLDVDWRGTVAGVPRYQLQILAPSPYKFGATSSASTGFYNVPDGVGLVFDLFPTPPTGGSLDFNTASVVSGIATVENPGTAAASVVVSVAGPTPDGGFVITDLSTGKRLRWLGDVVPAGSTLVFDGRDGTVVIDGVADRSGDAIIEAWPVVPAGGDLSLLIDFVVPGTSTAVMTVECEATYW